MLTSNLKQWRKSRNITQANTKVFIANCIEELLEICYEDKEFIEAYKESIMEEYFYLEPIGELNTIDSICDLQVFAINEVELMGYDNIKCNSEVFKEINSRRQCPEQFLEWQEKGSCGKWKKSLLDKDKKDWYKADYSKCKLIK